MPFASLALVSLLPGVQQQIPVLVNPHVELTSIVFRLAEAGEYSQAPEGMPYAKRVDAWFGKYKSHETIKLAQEIREKHGIGFNAVASFAVHLKPKEFKLKLTGAALRNSLDQRWEEETANQFAASLKKFAQDTRFSDFFESEQPFYSQSTASMSRLLAKRPYVEWFEDMFGKRANTPFTVILGLLNGGPNYGESVKYPDGHAELSPVLGAGEIEADGVPVWRDSAAGLVVHEFAHTYTNSYVDDYWKQLAGPAKTIFKHRAKVLLPQAYGDAQTLMYESLVRSMTVRFGIEKESPELAAEFEARETRRGFFWTGELAKRYDEFRADRKKYPVFKDFMPRVVEFFSEVAQTMPERMAKLPRMVSSTVASGSVVAPGESTVSIEFDRPMDTTRKGLGGLPIVEWADKTTGARWSQDKRTVNIRVKLEPNTDYTLTIGTLWSPSYQSEEGWPLDPITIKFKTKVGE